MKKLMLIILVIINAQYLCCQIYNFEKKPDNTPQVEQNTKNPYRWRLSLEENNIEAAIWNDNLNGNPNINLEEDFCIKFSAQFSTWEHDGGADGIAFVLRNPYNSTELGSGGASIGYREILHKLAIEFDTYFNNDPDYDNLSYDHIGYFHNIKLGADDYIIDGQVNVADGDWYLIEIQWNHQTKILSTYVEGVLAKSYELTNAIIDDISNNGSQERKPVRWGFTTGTAAHKNEHSIQMISVQQEMCCPIDIKIVSITGIGGEDFAEQYPEYTPENFISPLPICAGSSVTLLANVNTNITRVIWHKLVKINGQWQTATNNPDPADNEPDFPLIQIATEIDAETFYPTELTMYTARAEYDDGCIACWQIIIEPINFEVRMTQSIIEVCQENTQEIRPIITLNGIDYQGPNIATEFGNPSENGWITWNWEEQIEPENQNASLIAGSTINYNLFLDFSVYNFYKAYYKVTASYHKYFNGMESSDFIMTCTKESNATVIQKRFYPEIKIKKALCKEGCEDENCIGQIELIVKDLFGREIVVSSDYNIIWYKDNIQWGADQTNRFIKDITFGGTYSVRVIKTNSTPCVNTASIVIEQKDFKILEVKGKDLCSEGSPETWEVFHNECEPDYTYLWTCESGTPTEAILGLNTNKTVQIQKGGKFKVRVTNSNGCYVEQTFTVKNKKFDCELIVRQLCPDENSADPIVEIKVFGGNPTRIVNDKPEFDYNWSGTYTPTYDPDEPNIITLPVGRLYHLKVRDADGCEWSHDINVIVPNFEAHDYYGVCDSESVQLKTYKGTTTEETDFNSGENLVWTPSDGLNNSINELEPIATPNRDITYTGTLTYYLDENGTLNIGCKTVRCSVKVVKSGYDFVKGITQYTVTNTEIEIDGISPSERVIYQPEENFDCGFLIFNNYIHLDPPNCIRYRGVGISRFGNDDWSNPLWDNYYGVKEYIPFEIVDKKFLTTVRDIINVWDNNKSFHNKVFQDRYLLAIGSYNPAVPSDNSRNQNILLMKLNPADGEIIQQSGVNKIDTISIPGKCENAIKAIQSKDNQYIYVLGWVNNSISEIINPQDCKDIILMKLSTSTLQPVWEKIYSTTYYDVPYDLIETSSNDIIIVGEFRLSETDHKTFLLKVDSDGTIIASKKYYCQENDINLSNKIFKDGNQYIVCGTNKCSNLSNNNNIQIFRVDDNLNLIQNSSFAIGINDDIEPEIEAKNVFLKSAVINKNNNLDIVVHHKPLNIINETYSLHYLEVDPDNQTINKSIYYKSTPQHELNCDYPITQSLPNLINQNLQGLASLASVTCFINDNYDETPAPNYTDKSNEAVYIKFNTFKNITQSQPTNCLLNDNIFKIYDLFINSLNVTFNPENLATNNSATLVQLIKEDDNMLTTSSICDDLPICHCDETHINIDITQNISTQWGCNFNIIFTPDDELFNNCSDIRSVDIYDGFDWKGTISTGILTAGTPYSSTFRVSDFSGLKTLTIHYLDATGNIVCSTTKDIVCGCSCNDFYDNLKFDFKLVSESTIECCYDLYINNLNNPCAFREMGLVIGFPAVDPSNPTYNLYNHFSFIPEANWSQGSRNESENTLKLNLGNSQTQINGGENVKIGQICVDRDNILKTITIKIDNANCIDTWSQDLGCLKSCCEYINNVTFAPTTSNSEFCCYTLDYDIIGDISDCSIDIKLQIKYNGKVLYEITPQSIIEGNYSIPVCIEKSKLEGLPQELDLSIDFVSVVGDDEIIVCSKELEAVVNCLTCCDDIQVTMSSEPTYDDGNQCCFEYNVEVDSETECSGISKIVVEDIHGNILHISSIPIDLIIGGSSNQFSICISKGEFLGETSLKIKIKFINAINQEICNKEVEITACHDIPESCTPDNLDIPWIDGSGYLSFKCSDDPNEPPCVIFYTYQYRHVIVNGISIHRDVQILSYSFNSDCACESTAIASIFWDIINKQEVREEFNIDEQVSTNEGGTCFLDFRVITSDCWQQIVTPLGQVIYNRRCDGITCCYAIYLVCYEYNMYGQIVSYSFVRTSIVSSSSNCAPLNGYPCNPNNCSKFSPLDDSSVSEDVKISISLGDDAIYPFKISLNPYDDYVFAEDSVLINQDDLNNLLNISIINSGKGEINIQIFGILGNLISTNIYYKDSRNFYQAINSSLNSGIYFCRVKLNNQVIGSKKIIIVK